MHKRRKWQTRIRWVVWTSAALVGLTVLLDVYVGQNNLDRISVEVENVGERPVALVLGTAKDVQGRPNLFYRARIDAAAELYHAGKVRGVLVSGGSSRTNDDEAGAMKRDLVDQGVPAQYITCDYAGFRTLDSIIRAECVFGQSEYVVVSQRFHCERALFLARALRHDAVAFCAEDVPGLRGVRVRMRETVARCIAVLDVSGIESRRSLDPMRPSGFARYPTGKTMAEFSIVKKDENTFEVTVQANRTTTHQVSLSEAYYQKLAGGKGTKEGLIQASFEFLLERESNSSILSQFDLPVIGRYFPEYERSIRGRLGV